MVKDAGAARRLRACPALSIPADGLCLPGCPKIQAIFRVRCRPTCWSGQRALLFCVCVMNSNKILSIKILYFSIEIDGPLIAIKAAGRPQNGTGNEANVIKYYFETESCLSF
jgi:hypothetical protein